MRLEFMLLSTVVYCRGGSESVTAKLTLPADVAMEVDALTRDDYEAYARIHGMNLTFHTAVTPDGWVLSLWRIRSMDIYDEKLSAPVILAHGTGSSSFDFMWNLRNQSTAFVLADNGYDVWLVNFRGNQFSKTIMVNGATRDPKPEEYYKATWQYTADLDLPTLFHKVLSETEQSKFYLIGHSLGSTVSFALLSCDHSYDDKLSHLAAVAPVLKFGDDTSLALKTGLIYVPPLIEGLQVTVPVISLPSLLLFEYLFGRRFTGWGEIETFVKTAVCAVLPRLCLLLLTIPLNRDIIGGISDDPHLNKTRSAVYFSKFPGGVTAMNGYNYAIQWGKDPWEKIDFRKLPLTGFTNEEEYNSTEPPKYDFAAIKVPFSLFYVMNDVFTGTETAKKVIAELNATDYKFIEGNGMTHTDAVSGLDTRCYTINDIMLKFQDLENARDSDHEEYRRRVATFVKALPFEDGCQSSNI